MQFYLNGYKPGDRDIREPATGIGERSVALPDAVDVLIVGSGPSGAERLGLPREQLESLKGLARLALSLNEIDVARSYAAQIEACLAIQKSVDGVADVLLICFHVHAEAGRMDRATPLLKRARDLLTTQANTLDLSDKTEFLKSVPSHAAILKAWTRTVPAGD
jgi:hypothetical protein